MFSLSSLSYSDILRVFQRRLLSDTIWLDHLHNLSFSFFLLPGYATVLDTSEPLSTIFLSLSLSQKLLPPLILVDIFLVLISSLESGGDQRCSASPDSHDGGGHRWRAGHGGHLSFEATDSPPDPHAADVFVFGLFHRFAVTGTVTVTVAVGLCSADSHRATAIEINSCRSSAPTAAAEI